MKKLLSILATLVMFLMGCATSKVTIQDNVFVSEGSPNIRVKVDAAFVPQPVWKWEGIIKGGDAAGTRYETSYLFLPSQKSVDRAVFILFSDLDTTSKNFWRNAGDGTDKDIDGTTMRVMFSEIYKVAPGLVRDFTAKGRTFSTLYSSIWFKKIVNPQRMLHIGYIETAVGQSTADLEKRAREAFKIQQ